MADIDIERKSSSAWIWWLLGIILLALLLWWLLADSDEAEVVEPVAPAAVVEEPVLPAAEPMAPAVAGAALPIGEILASPGTWTGRTVSGTAMVAEVPTDRGFWLESGGQRMFAILIDQPAEEPKDVNPQQMVDLQNVTVRDASYLSQVEGAPLDDQTRQLAEGQQAYLVVPESALMITEAGNPQPGTDPAQTAP